MPSGAQTCPSMSWIMKRPTRVPASTAVRMKSASNRIAKWYQNASIDLPPSACARICAMPTASVGAPPARDRMVVSPMSFAVWLIMLGRDDEAPARDHLRRPLRRRADHRRRAVHHEVDARIEHAGRGDRHHRHERFHEHAAVADQPDVPFALDHLRRRPRGDEGMEARDRAARDGDEQEREQAAREHRPGAVDEPGDVGHLQASAPPGRSRARARRWCRS